ncbi:MAG: S1 RNA-binding domain-containing protein [Parcubacteria group bacterium]|nr:S1 RNA-binding domain-containing protein [Parcubacteria group bacterium]
MREQITSDCGKNDGNTVRPETVHTTNEMIFSKTKKADKEKKEDSSGSSPVKITAEASLPTDEKNLATISPMVDIIEASKRRPDTGSIVEGKIISIEKNALYVDLGSIGTGIIYGREFMNARDTIKKVHAGDAIAAKVVEPENEDGYVELSLKEARQALIWEEAEEAMEKKTAFEILVKEANKGGLMLEWQGIKGFLPASQLSPEHYPRVENGNKERIFSELQKFIGEKLSVSIISADPKEEKLIFSEKGGEEKGQTELAEKYKIGDIVEGEVTGIVDFGLFVKVEDGLEGLVHISEMDWGLVEDPRAMFKVGEKVTTQVIEVKDGKVSLSIKALRPNPWLEAGKKYAKGDVVKGIVIKHNKHGALVSIEEGVAGLAHISEFGDLEKLKETLELGKTYSFKITLFEPKEQRLTFSYKEAQETESRK